ncbi:hypothetical protein AAC387_Pa06g1259 [Persea americana]
MQQQQQPPPMLIPPFPSTNITTEQIQKCLDENKQLILAILDNQNLGKLAECAQFQTRLQHNLMYLAAIADAQPQAPAVPPQAVMQQAGHYMQHPQMVGAQQSIFAQKVPSQFNQQQMQEYQHQQHQLHHQHPQSVQGHMGMRPGAANGVHAMHSENTLSSSGGPPTGTGLGEFTRPGASSGSIDGRGNKQDAGTGLESGSSDVHGSSGGGPSTADVEPSYLKGSEESGKMP